MLKILGLCAFSVATMTSKPHLLFSSTNAILTYLYKDPINLNEPCFKFSGIVVPNTSVRIPMTLCGIKRVWMMDDIVFLIFVFINHHK